MIDRFVTAYSEVEDRKTRCRSLRSPVPPTSHLRKSLPAPGRARPRTPIPHRLRPLPAHRPPRGLQSCVLAAHCTGSGERARRTDARKGRIEHACIIRNSHPGPGASGRADLWQINQNILSTFHSQLGNGNLWQWQRVDNGHRLVEQPASSVTNSPIASNGSSTFAT